jgi:hypothetical protein
MAPGLTALAYIPSPAQRSSVSTVWAAYRRWLLELSRGTGAISPIRS